MVDLTKTTSVLEITAKTTGVDQAAAALEGVATAQESVSKSTLSAERAWERLQKTNDQNYAALVRFEKQNNDAKRAIDLKLTSDERYNEVLALNKQRLDDATGATERLAAGLKKVMLTQGQLAPEVKSLGTSELQKAQASIDKALVDSTANLKRYNQAAEQSKPAQEAAAQSTNKAAQAADNFNKSLNAGTGEQRLARHELINLSRQFQDVGVGLASGQGFFTIMVQQGSQIADVFATSTGTLKGFFTQAVGGAARFLGSAAGIATTVGTMGAAIGFAAASYASGQKEIERSLTGIGRASGVTRDQINQIAEASASAYGLSVSEARTAATAFAATGRIYQQNVGAATKIIDSYARAGGDATEVTKMLATALQDPAAGAMELNKQFGFLDATTLNYIRSLQAAGDLQGAQAALMQAAAPAIQKAAEATGFWAKAWNLATNSASEYFEMIGKIALRSVEGVTGIETGGYSKAEEYQRARAKLDERRKYTGPLAQPGIKAQEEVVSQKEQALIAEGLEKTATRLRQLSLEADTAARAFMPLTAEIEKTLFAMNRLQEQRLTSGGEVTGAEKVGSVKLLQLEQENAALVRQAEVTSAIALLYPGMTIQGALQLYNLQQQAVAAAAVGTAQQLQAQQQANINMMTAQGKGLHEATAIAVGQTALAQAQINAQAQLQLVTAQQNLTIAQARTGAEQMAAQEAVKIQQLLAQQVPLETALRIAATERATAEEKVDAAIENQIKSLQDQERLMRARQNGNEGAVKAEMAYKKAIDAGSSPALAAQLRDATLRVERIREAEEAERDLGQAMGQNQTDWERAQQAQQSAANNANAAQREYNQLINAAIQKVAELKDKWSQIPAVMVTRTGTEVKVIGAPQFPTFTDPVTGRPSQIDPAGHTSEVLWPIGPNAGPLEDRIDTMLSKGKSLWETLGKVLKEDPMSNIASSITSLLPENQQSTAIQARISALMGGPRTIESETLIKTLNEQLKQLSQSTDALNSTMQQALSPYYSQDPRTTKLGFRAGVRANPDWMTGATNENPVTAVLGPGAIAPSGATAPTTGTVVPPGEIRYPYSETGGAKLTGGAIMLPDEVRYPSGRTGFASGGSFIVPGGYSATDNKMVQFPAASGEQVVVNRNPQSGDKPSVVNVDNRIVINGSVDQDTLNKLKISRFQQTQRMRDGMAAA